MFLRVKLFGVNNIPSKPAVPQWQWQVFEHVIFFAWPGSPNVAPTYLLGKLRDHSNTPLIDVVGMLPLLPQHGIPLNRVKRSHQLIWLKSTLLGIHIESSDIWNPNTNTTKIDGHGWFVKDNSKLLPSPKLTNRWKLMLGKLLSEIWEGLFSTGFCC